MIVTHAQFLPDTLGGWAAVAAAIGSGGAAILGLRNRSKIQEVHVLVNNQKTQLETALAEMTEKRDTLVADREAAHTDTPPTEVTIVQDPSNPVPVKSTGP